MKGEENDTKDQREHARAIHNELQMSLEKTLEEARENGSRSQNRRRVQRFKKTVGRRRRQ